VIFVVFLASCANAGTTPPLSDGGGGAAGAGGTGNGGGGGSALGDAGPLVDAGPCEPFAEVYTQACLACLGASCCDVAQTCFQMHDCFGYASCQQNCPPPGPDGGANVCLDACAHNFPMAQPAFGAMTDCLHAMCAGACPY
jgi:hypothetical protein